MFKRPFAALLIFCVVLGGGALAWAQTSPPRPTLDASAETSTTPSGDATAKRTQVKACVQQARQSAGQGGDRASVKAAVKKCFADAGIARGGRGGKDGNAGILGRVVHGDLVVRGKDGGFENVTYDRGTLERVSGDSLTLKRPDGVSVTVTLTPTTKYRGASGVSDLKTGQPAVVVSKDHNAIRVGQHSP